MGFQDMSLLFQKYDFTEKIPKNTVSTFCVPGIYVVPRILPVVRSVSSSIGDESDTESTLVDSDASSN